MSYTRDDYAQGLRDLADWLDDNPAIPMHLFSEVGVRYSVSVEVDDDEVALTRLAEIADLIGAEIEVTANGDHHDAVKRFGPVSYQAAVILKERQAAYTEHMKPFHERMAARGPKALGRPQ